MTRAYQTPDQAASATTSCAEGLSRYSRPAPQPANSTQHPRQPEPRHGAVVDEPRDSRDPLTRQRQHDHPVRAEHLRLVVLQVAAEGRLAVRTGRHEPVVPGTAPARDVAQEAGDRL